MITLLLQFARLVTNYIFFLLNVSATVVDASYKPKSVHNPDGATNSSGADAMNFSLLYIAARHIMFIHIPENVDIAETMDIHVSPLKLFLQRLNPPPFTILTASIIQARRREAAEYASSGGKRRRRT